MSLTYPPSFAVHESRKSRVISHPKMLGEPQLGSKYFQVTNPACPREASNPPPELSLYTEAAGSRSRSCAVCLTPVTSSDNLSLFVGLPSRKARDDHLITSVPVRREPFLNLWHLSKTFNDLGGLFRLHLVPADPANSSFQTGEKVAKVFFLNMTADSLLPMGIHAPSRLECIFSLT